MAANDFIKDPDAVLDYKFDWTQWLALDEIIESSTVLPSPGITVDSSVFTDNTSTVWLSAGTSGTLYSVTNRITTNQGRIDDRTIKVRVSSR